MFYNYKSGEYKQSTFMTVVQIILLILIIAGLTLLFTQKHWVPGVVNYILESEKDSGDQV